MNIISTPSQLSSKLNHSSRPRILVPTMGALHEGHLSLIKQARKLAGSKGTVIVTIFVNPSQFNNPDDLTNYPRTMEKDLSLCTKSGVDFVFTPNPDHIYLPDHSVTVTESSLSQKLCGASRPGHFDGVCTIVLKLLNLTQPDIAVFGKKDYQQLAIIRRMVRDLNIQTKIESVDTVREPSGLALSSRNTRLTKKQYLDAPRIRQALLAAQSAYRQGETSASTLLDIARHIIEAGTAGAEIDYLELLDAESLQTIGTVKSPALLATAVFYHPVRLIDNIEL